MRRIPRLVVSGTSSGVGKTSVACGVIRALRGAGAAVQAFKVGPDYIDTGYLAEASGRPAANLDTWMMGRAGVVSEYEDASEGADVSVIEGVMGYYDGSGEDGAHSTYHVAGLLRAPVVLVVDAGRTGHSVGAAVLGFRRYRRGSNIAGVILNRLGSERHEAMCRAAAGRAGAAVLGAVPRDPALSVGTGSMGLVQARQAGGRRAVSRIAARIARYLDAGALLKAARTAGEIGRAGRGRRPREKAEGEGRGRRPGKAGPTICVARDEAFSLYYRGSLENLRRAGAAVRFFSPVSDRRLPECDALYVGGGVPEEHAAALEGNAAMRRSVRRFADGGGPVYAEGGGAAYMAASLECGQRRHAMAAVVDCRAVFGGRLRLGYVGARALPGCPVAAGRSPVNGHAFHHLEMRGIGRGARFAYEVLSGPAMRRRRRGEAHGADGITGGGGGQNTVASLMQVHMGHGAARRLVAAAARHARK